jgi:membrane protein involved in colicin uptake
MADTRIEVNCETGEVKEIPLTSAEIAQREADAKAFAEEQAKRDAEAAAKAKALEAAKAKLATLGLSADELSALLG